ncbi:MAG: hypothetical protein OXD33_04595 [Rhodobacteraceae bacterium]|nr:hypothetical protein [Paracoccaceae bacterium]MCY4327560.1 hypothetical protein [Paracoccaceae bacterium]
MNARVARLDFHCDVVFARPVFSRVASFAQIIEPMFLLVAVEYKQGSRPEKFVDRRTGHVDEIWRLVAGSIGLTII